MKFSTFERSQNIRSTQKEVYDLAIIGGGITGAGIARDAASRGMKVVLVESKDFAIGTSSRSSKLIHGGIRYLENFEFHLVFEALSERSILFEMAPHLVHPLRFVIPIYKKSRVGYWKMAAGMWLYDLLAVLETPQMHEALSQSDTQRRLPLLKSKELVGAFEYSDAYMDDDRLVIETLRDAHNKGVKAINFAEVQSFEKNGDQIVSMNVKDQLGGETFKIKAKQFMTSVGPWTDLFGQENFKPWKQKLRPTKGVHITFSRDKFPVEKAVVMAVEQRIIFVIPRHEMVIVGTTDTDFNKNPYDVTTEAEDVQYLLKALDDYFPEAQLKESDIIASYSGVRPLVDDGAETEGKTSREHSIFSAGPNISFIAGGKYTTYRKMSEDAVDFVLNKMSFDEKMSFTASNTKTPLNKKVTVGELQKIRNQRESLKAEYSVSLASIDRLIERHGLEALEILEIMKSKFSLHSEEEALWMGEALFAIENTMCMNLEDFYWRRSPLFLAHKDHGLKFVDAITKVFAQYYTWSDSVKEENKTKLINKMNETLKWKN